MSWSRRSFLAAALVAATAGCGFQPLYAPPPPPDTGATAEAGAAALARVRIDRIPNRSGQLVYDELRDRLNPQGEPLAPAYRLQVTTATSSEGIALQRDSFATRVNLRMTGNWRLIDVADGEILSRGQVRSVAGYDSGAAPFATRVAREVAQARAAREIGTEIAARLALYFHRRAEGMPTRSEPDAAEQAPVPDQPLLDQPLQEQPLSDQQLLDQPLLDRF